MRVASSHALAYLVAKRLAWWPWLGRLVPLARVPGPKRFRQLFEDLGGSFIKFGQMLALQPDMVSREYCDELFDLLDRIEPFPFAHVEQMFQDELGRTPQQIFEWIDPEPLATASIGQVHVAYLNGQKVAVKVQRPHVDIEFAGDIRVMLFVVRVIRRLNLRSLFWTLAPISEFAAWTLEELDYRREARYADKLRRNATDNPYERVPGIYWNLTTRRTLVMEYMSGVTALEYLRAVTASGAEAGRSVCPDGFEPDNFARHIIDNFLGDAFRYGVFHADLHPANLLMLPGEVVAYVDFGITGVLSGYSRRHLVEMTLVLARGEVEALTELFFDLTVQDDESDPGLFRREMKEISRDWYAGEGADVALRKNFTQIFLDMLILCRKARLSPEQDVVKYIRSAVAADGLITRLAPGFDVGRYLEEACQRLVTAEMERATLTGHQVGALLSSTARLMDTGAARTAAILQRLADGRLTARVDVEAHTDRDARYRTRTLRLAGVVVALTALVELTGGPARVGFNMFTVEAVLAGAALIMLVASIRKLVGS